METPISNLSIGLLCIQILLLVLSVVAVYCIMRLGKKWIKYMESNSLHNEK